MKILEMLTVILMAGLVSLITRPLLGKRLSQYGLFVLNIFSGIIMAVILSCMFKWLPVLNKVSSGFVIIICAVIASAAGALLYPIDDDAEEKD